MSLIFNVPILILVLPKVSSTKILQVIFVLFKCSLELNPCKSCFQIVHKIWKINHPKYNLGLNIHGFLSNSPSMLVGYLMILVVFQGGIFSMGWSFQLAK
jgi:hypothetical protein